MRDYICIDLSRESAPDASSLLQFRHLLERQQLAAQLFVTVNAKLRNQGLLMCEGTIADATRMATPPPSTHHRR